MKSAELIESLKAAIVEDEAALAAFVPRETIQSRIDTAKTMLQLCDPASWQKPAKKKPIAKRMPNCALCGKAFSRHGSAARCPGGAGSYYERPNERDLREGWEH